MTTYASVLLPPGGQRILVIIAHPDDAESFCCGSMARLAAEGRDIHYLVITRGDKGSNDPHMTPERLSSIREDEQRQAANILVHRGRRKSMIEVESGSLDLLCKLDQDVLSREQSISGKPSHSAIKILLVIHQRAAFSSWSTSKASQQM